MPIEIGLWKLGRTVEAVRQTRLESESELEAALAADMDLLGPGTVLKSPRTPARSREASLADEPEAP